MNMAQDRYPQEAIVDEIRMTTIFSESWSHVLQGQVAAIFTCDHRDMVYAYDRFRQWLKAWSSFYHECVFITTKLIALKRAGLFILFQIRNGYVE